ncbi:MAG: PaaI family thioesterase [Candidatus Lokiarchaeota archaeon]|nr:PaaI family thioesterase [Candidatus Lokiarchaeota archaeon]
MNEKKAIQDFYSDQMSHCYGCGRLNNFGMKLKSYWNEEEESSIATYIPKAHQTAFPGFVYGGLIASLIDCHGTGTAAAAAYKAEGRKIGTEPELRYVTASLHVDYLKPTPIDQELVLIGKVKEIKGRKVTTEVKLFAAEQLCAQGEVITVKIPETMIFKK